MINNVVLVGRITKDIELRKTQSNISTVNFTLAVDGFKDNVDFINCVAWRQSADFLAQYAQKGALIGVEGRVTTRNYDGKNGKVYVTEVTCDHVEIYKNPTKQGQQEQVNTTMNDLKKDTSINNEFYQPSLGGDVSTPEEHDSYADIKSDDLPFY